MPSFAHELLQTTLAQDRARILSSLIRTCGGDFDLAEESLHDAVVAAVTQWPQTGPPRTPDAWLLQTARHKAIDALRRDARKHELLGSHRHQGGSQTEREPEAIPYDMLRLIFTCCHPALHEEAQLALTLRTVVGLPTIEISRAFLVTEKTMAQRLVRAKKKIRDAGIPYRIPDPEDMEERLGAVLLVVYLLFNEGYSASSGESVVRHELCAHAIHVGRILRRLLPEQREVSGLLALMLLQDSRRSSRMDPDGDLVLLRDQDRSQWDHTQIQEGLELCENLPIDGPYVIQARIAAEHARPRDAADTNWREVARLYRALLRVHPTPVVALNHAVASAMTDGPERGLRLLGALEADLERYGPFHATRADLLRQLQRWTDAASAYERALELATHQPERRFLEGRLRDVRSRC